MQGYALVEGERKKPLETAAFRQNSTHIGEAFYGLCKILNGFISVAALDAVAHAMADMPLEHHLAAFMQRGFRRVQLHENVLARHVLIHHTVDRLHLPDDFPQPAVQVFGVHALLHSDKPPGGSFFRRVRAFI